jgi:hypothetical protein
MLKKISFLSLAAILTLTSFIFTAGCSPGTTTSSTTGPSNTPATQTGQTPAGSEFGRTLGLVPYSFLSEHDVWFGNPAEALAINGIQNINGLNELMALPAEQRSNVSHALSGIAAPVWKTQQLAPIAGFDYWMIDRDVFVDTPPPWAFSVSEGSFDGQLINDKLTSLGYQKKDYDSYSYYALNEDFSPGDLSSPMSQAVLSSMNRIAVVDDNTLITAPATDIMTGILDAISGKQESVIDNPAGRALADSLGEVLSGVIMNPERALNQNPPQEAPPFNFTIPSDWGTLHQYQMVGMGYSDNGNDRFWTVSLYYEDAQDAQADANILVTRMKSYTLNTQFNQGSGQTFKPVPFTDKFDVGEPQVQQYPEGATLTIECELKPETPGNDWLIPMAEFRDFLFLAPDPSPYVSKTATTLEEAKKQLEETGYALADTAEKASQLAGYQVATPSFIPEGFVPSDNDGNGGIFVINNIFFGRTPAAGPPYQVSQRYSLSPDPTSPREPFFAIVQTSATPGFVGGIQEDVTIGGHPGKKVITYGQGDAPDILNFHWNDGTLTYDLVGTLEAPLDEEIMIEVAASMRVD